MAMLITACGVPSQCCGGKEGHWRVSVSTDTRNGDAAYYAEGQPVEALQSIADQIVTHREVVARPT